MAVLLSYRGDEKYRRNESIPNILNRCDQALQTLERYKSRLNGLGQPDRPRGGGPGDAERHRRAAALEMVSRIADELRHHLIELGADGRLVRLN